MKILTHFAAIVTAAFLLAGCHGDPKPRTSDPKSEAATELKRSLEVERESRLGVERRLAEQERSKSSWQTAALLAVSGAIVLLVIGTVLGTRAKHDSCKPS
jgi:PBP1b-binding outer membrane lipoprotein LpoB